MDEIWTWALPPSKYSDPQEPAKLHFCVTGKAGASNFKLPEHKQSKRIFLNQVTPLQHVSLVISVPYPQI